jgi:hypothetical protein
VRIRLQHTTFLLATAAAAVAIAAAPNASAAPSEQRCLHTGESTACQTPGNVQAYTSPRALPRVFPPSINPRWRDLGYSAPFPNYGFDPKWQAFGYNPKYSGFQPRPSVLRTTPQKPNGTDIGGSIMHQNLGNAQITAQIGLAARTANQPLYPGLVASRAATGGSTTYQNPGNAQISAQPGRAAQNADQQATFFPVPTLPRK